MSDYAGWTLEWAGDVLVGTHDDGRSLSLGEVQGLTWRLLRPSTGAVIAGGGGPRPHTSAERQVLELGGRIGPVCLSGPELRVWRERSSLTTRELATQLQPLIPTRSVSSIASTLSQVEREQYSIPGYLRAALRAILDQPSSPPRGSDPSTHEGTPARASDVAAQPSSGEQGGVASPGAGAPQAVDRTRQPELGGASPPPAADPCSPLSRPSGDSSTAAPAAVRADLRADREGDEPGEGGFAQFAERVYDHFARLQALGPLPVVTLADGVHYSTGNCFGAEHGSEREAALFTEAQRLQAELRTTRADSVAYETGVWERVAELEQEVARLRAQHDSERERADTADAITRATLETLRGYDDEIARLRERTVSPAAWDMLVSATLDRLGVPAGSHAWRLGWLEGRELGRGGGR